MVFVVAVVFVVSVVCSILTPGCFKNCVVLVVSSVENEPPPSETTPIPHSESQHSPFCWAPPCPSLFFGERQGNHQKKQGFFIGTERSCRLTQNDYVQKMC